MFPYMDQPASDPQKHATPRPPRQRLIRRTSPSVPKTDKRAMLREYNAAYRENLVKNGVPTRRMMAEAIMQAVVEEVMAKPPTDGSEIDLHTGRRAAAKRILALAAQILKSVVNRNGQPIYGNEGIRRRISKVADGMTTP
jgi:glycerol-3-phosphate dehydrogenase